MLLKKESNIPFLKRYLKREETLQRVEALNRQLDQELQILGVWLLPPILLKFLPVFFSLLSR